VKRMLVVLMVATLLLSGCSGGVGKPKEVLLKPHSDRYYGIMYPKGFYADVQKYSNGSEIFIALSTEEPSYNLSVMRTAPLGRNIEPKDFEVLVQTQIDSKYNNRQVNLLDTLGFRTKQGNQAFKMIYTKDVYGEERGKHIEIITYHKNIFVLIILSSKESEFGARLGVFDEIVDSFEFLF